MELTAKMQTSGANRVDEPGMRFVTLSISHLAFEALAQGHLEAAQQSPEARIETAIRFYLRDKESGVAAWPFPAFLRGADVREEVELRLGLDEDLWRRFEAEAAHQDVSVQQLSEHAAFYLAAELEAGRITQRILDELERDGPPDPRS
ncbi:MAG: hypothetical protein ABW065_06805 [Solirubrobacterales bacterium]